MAILHRRGAGTAGSGAGGASADESASLSTRRFIAEGHMTACAYANMRIRRRAGDCVRYDFLVISGIDAQEVCMSRNTSVSLGDHFVSFIDAQVKGGRYGSAS
ncbi:type II toxin-antitoxin system ParD family antitoxin, partial [Paracoccus sp. (in: a-proteobacteria)]|uniref:type II toxin-antitoxin system ParD family antitoxin n=1 Tax=Paracoccus sp. TaxID=267 RepID=UPI0039E628EB